MPKFYSLFKRAAYFLMHSMTAPKITDSGMLPNRGRSILLSVCQYWSGFLGASFTEAKRSYRENIFKKLLKWPMKFPPSNDARGLPPHWWKFPFAERTPRQQCTYPGLCTCASLLAARTPDFLSQSSPYVNWKCVWSDAIKKDDSIFTSGLWNPSVCRCDRWLFAWQLHKFRPVSSSWTWRTQHRPLSFCKFFLHINGRT